MKPFIIDETENFAVLFKPPRMHSAASKQKSYNITDWFAEYYPPSAGQGWLLHRLDFETRGLLLAAKNQKSYDYLHSLQVSGDFVKVYGAICVRAKKTAPGFPPPPDLTGFLPAENSQAGPFVIESFFRSYGNGRKQVRPAVDDKSSVVAKDQGDNMYRTEVLSVKDNFFTVRLIRGFRHQIRCHLAWIGFQIKNDPLYNLSQPFPREADYLALCAQAFSFSDPETGVKREYRIDFFGQRL